MKLARSSGEEQNSAKEPAIPRFPSTSELAAKNAMYDRATSHLWRIAVYEPLHQGWEFANLGGVDFLEDVALRSGLNASHCLLELCCGTGDTCRYLATRFGCRVTGVEINPAQLRRAREGAAQLPDDLRRRLRFVPADVTTWSPDRTYDVVTVIDSLSLVALPQRAIAVASAALNPGGHLLFSDILVGSRRDDRALRQAWDYDGMRPLGNAAHAADLLRSLGLTDVVLADRTADAVRHCRTIRSALDRHSSALTAAAGEAEVAAWCETIDFYIRSFRSGSLEYWWGAGRAEREGDPNV